MGLPILGTIVRARHRGRILSSRFGCADGVSVYLECAPQYGGSDDRTSGANRRGATGQPPSYGYYHAGGTDAGRTKPITDYELRIKSIAAVQNYFVLLPYI